MVDTTKSSAKSGILLATAVCVLALPSAVLALTTRFEPQAAGEGQPRGIAPIDGEIAGLKLARALPLHLLSRGSLYPFTPAKNPNRPDRSVTVAVRVDPSAFKDIVVQGSRDTASQADTPLRIAQTGFNLGVARGYHNFAPDLAPQPGARKPDVPDLTAFTLAPGAQRTDSRFGPRIVLDQKQPAGRAPQTFAGDRDDQVDLGGSYRLSRNLNVTAGVRYSEDHERLVPLTDGKLDSQSVYVGTQFRF